MPLTRPPKSGTLSRKREKDVILLEFLPSPRLRGEGGEPFAVILSEAKDHGISAQGELREPGEGRRLNFGVVEGDEESLNACVLRCFNARFFRRVIRLDVSS